jgi:rod shape determining protein RodA
MAKRSWRSFDFLLLGALLLLSAYGVLMIYSATINTSGLGNPVQRQLVYAGVGVGLLLLIASIDYRLLEIVQHPFSILPPLVLGLGTVLIAIMWPLQQGMADSLTPDLVRSVLPAAALGLVLVFAVYVADRLWISVSEPVLRRFIAAVIVVAAAIALALFVSRQGTSRLLELVPTLAGLGIAVVYLLDCLTLRVTDIFRNPLYVLVLAVLAIMFEVGQVAGGAQSWLGAGMIQPSEPAKIAVIVVLAKFLADHEERLDEFGIVLASLGIVALPMVLIYLQPDLGTAIVLAAVWAAMLWTAGMRLRHWLVLIVAGVAVLPLVWFGLQDYMRQRLMLFIDPSSDPDSYFNIHQALVSVGSGGWLGNGLTHGTHSQLHFLRVRHTDFIFAVTAEELGFLGAAVMVGLVFFILWRTLRVAEQSRDTFGRLICAGVAAVILFQTIINVGMNLGLMPVTGLPLPFVSYGGSAYLTLIVGMGLVESVALRHKRLEFD